MELGHLLAAGGRLLQRDRLAVDARRFEVGECERQSLEVVAVERGRQVEDARELLCAVTTRAKPPIRT
jgi:hypothetical protein